MKKEEKASITLKKIICISILLLLFAGIGVMAANTKVSNVKIILSNGYEMKVLTSKTKISDILNENHIILLPDEKVTPQENDELSDNRTIRISKGTEEIEIATIAESSEDLTTEKILNQYDTIVEKIITEQITIPYETITKDVSNGSNSKQDKILQKGIDGLKEITYKVKYQNDVEIEKTEISSKIIKEPVNKIVEVRTKQVTSRSSANRTSSLNNLTSQSGESIGKYKITAYCSCSKCCGKATGRTASGTTATAGRTIAAPANFSFGTKLKINGRVYTVEDRGGAIKGNKIDIYMGSHSEAIAWGVRYLDVEILK